MRNTAASHGVDHPIERLGVWDGTGFVPVRRGSIQAERVHVMSHGWAPGLGPVVRRHDGFLRVWDEEATTASGTRFDRWYPRLADAIQERDSDAAVLGFTWVDRSATDPRPILGAQSQSRTNLAAQSLSIGLRAALSPGAHRLHLIGYSHGSKVVALAGLLANRPPEHLTLLDSPEGLLPMLGGAFNDLTAYLRLYDIGRGQDHTFIDTYPSAYGVHYGQRLGLGDVVEVALDPEAFPIEGAASSHSYAYEWYVDSLRHGVGLAWSPLFEDAPEPEARQLRQTGDHPWLMERNPEVSPAQPMERLIRQYTDRRGEPVVLETTGRRSYRTIRWRRSGDFAAMSRIRWISGPDDAEVSLSVQGTELWKSRNGWSDDPTRAAVVPFAGMRAGPKLVRLRIDSPEPAAVELHKATFEGMNVPTITELRAWVHPTFRAFTWPLEKFSNVAWASTRLAGSALSRAASIVARTSSAARSRSEAPDSDGD